MRPRSRSSARSPLRRPPSAGYVRQRLSCRLQCSGRSWQRSLSCIPPPLDKGMPAKDGDDAQNSTDQRGYERAGSRGPRGHMFSAYRGQQLWSLDLAGFRDELARRRSIRLEVSQLYEEQHFVGGGIRATGKACLHSRDLASVRREVRSVCLSLQTSIGPKEVERC